MKRRRTHFHSKSRFGFVVSGRLLGRMAGIIAMLTLKLASATTGAAEAPQVDFTRDVRPILANHCFKCHGPDEGARKAKLRLDVRGEAIKPAKSGEKAIVPGEPGKSELVTRIFTEVED